MHDLNSYRQQLEAVADQPWSFPLPISKTPVGDAPDATLRAEAVYVRALLAGWLHDPLVELFAQQLDNSAVDSDGGLSSTSIGSELSGALADYRARLMSHPEVRTGGFTQGVGDLLFVQMQIKEMPTLDTIMHFAGVRHGDATKEMLRLEGAFYRRLAELQGARIKQLWPEADSHTA